MKIERGDSLKATNLKGRINAEPHVRLSEKRPVHFRPEVLASFINKLGEDCKAFLGLSIIAINRSYSCNSRVNILGGPYDPRLV
jgi:hypothetical protein